MKCEERCGEWGVGSGECGVGSVHRITDYRITELKKTEEYAIGCAKLGHYQL
ncbi:MAG: hypothetical protein PHZ24_04665 [Bacteroidales bacterium]|nr:hypothetical protein [Bacteroidales bacterium]MDY0141012.1 hypothetical protein [Bacteroidales bacterium]